ADSASLLLLQFLARELAGSRLLVIGTYRDVEVGQDHPLRDLLRRIPGSCLHHLLGGLEPAQVAELMELLTGTAPDGELVASVHRRTGGNPLFVRELLGLLAAGDGADEGVPDGVREVIQCRLDRLSDPARALLAAAAVIGPQVRIDLLEAVCDASAEELAAGLAEAGGARLLEEVAGVVPRHRFTHVLVREVICSGLPAPTRRRLHHRAGAAIEDLFGEGVDWRLPQLAHHFGLAGACAEPGRAIEYTRRAGRR